MTVSSFAISGQHLSRIAGFSYLVIFIAAIFANFFMLESLKTQPLLTVQEADLTVRLGILAFLITAVFDVVVAWALHLLYRSHPLTGLSTLFRMMHAAIMGVAVFSLPEVLTSADPSFILQQINQFNTIWLIGLFFFGIHLILLAFIIKSPRFIALFLLLAGIMYMSDTVAHFMIPGYDQYSYLFLLLVAVPSLIGEMSLAVWLIIKGGKVSVKDTIQ
ncbi:DUF4386 domain-containing protein [Robertkochia flava]|uniref:DUF4386 domain-containing protein n=1 Tax=Robertkochia flava TaxID=3447986 RepID=UPI001CCDC193|nr:DUF4386 domain-containing protein [Robertkochia marina]